MHVADPDFLQGVADATVDGAGAGQGAGRGSPGNIVTCTYKIMIYVTSYGCYQVLRLMLWKKRSGQSWQLQQVTSGVCDNF